jgi:hypothetical protein
MSVVDECGSFAIPFAWPDGVSKGAVVIGRGLKAIEGLPNICNGQRPRSANGGSGSSTGVCRTFDELRGGRPAAFLKWTVHRVSDICRPAASDPYFQDFHRSYVEGITHD